MTAQEIQKKLRKLADREKAIVLRRFFKTGPGQYGDGDVFLGITVPALRKTAREIGDVPLADVLLLLRSRIHEHRFLALLLLMQAYRAGSGQRRERIYRLYVSNIRFINNWDLVDLSAPHILGNFLFEKPRDPLYRFARSNHLWSRRAAVVSTLAFIRMRDFSDTLAIVHLLLNDSQDLIHKAAGWMLREVGKRDQAVLETFLSRHYANMPRTMLRYAIERFPDACRRRYLNRARVRDR